MAVIRDISELRLLGLLHALGAGSSSGGIGVSL